MKRTPVRAMQLTLALLGAAACNPSAFDPAQKREDVSVEKDASTPAGGASGRSQATGGAVARSGGAAGASGKSSGKPAVDIDPLEVDAGPKPSPQDKPMSMTEPEPAKSATGSEACTAAHATGRCESGACRFECKPSYGDCDGDLARGSASNGCETALAADVSHCGRCDVKCERPSGGYATCAEASCVAHALSYAAVTPGPLHGTPNPTRVQQLCPDGMVLSGIDGFVDDDAIAESLRLRCSPLSLELDGDKPSITVGAATTPLPLNGGLGWEAVAMKHTPYEMQCAPGAVVSSMQLTLWSHWTNERAELYQTIKDFSVRCAVPRIDNGQVVLAEMGPPLSTGVNRDLDKGMSVQDSCGMQGLIRGFTLGYVTNIDELTMLCGKLSVSSERKR